MAHQWALPGTASIRSKVMVSSNRDMVVSQAIVAKVEIRVNVMEAKEDTANMAVNRVTAGGNPFKREYSTTLHVTRQSSQVVPPK
jgi:CRISPR/Cas system CSM-associated protein Csm3 (group 7 of RAMP superfamily)